MRPGACYRLVHESFFKACAVHSTPEIHRVSLEGLALQVLSMNLDVYAFSSTLLDAPRVPTLRRSLRGLKDMGATVGADDAPQLSALGGHLACLPCAARLGKLLVLGAALGVRSEALSVAAGLSVRSPWRSGEGDRDAADTFKTILRQDHQCGRSDHALVALAFDAFAARAADAPRGVWQRKRAMQPWCADRGLSYDPLNEMDLLRKQFDDALRDRGFLPSRARARVGGKPLVGAALWRVARALVGAALYPQVLKIEKPTQKYAESADGAVAKDAAARELRFVRRTDDGYERVFLHPASVCFKERSWPSPWAVYNECVETHKTYVRDCSEAAPYSLLLFGGNLEPKPLESLILVDGWIRFHANARVAALVAALRHRVDALLEAKAQDPTIDLEAAPVVKAILRLLLHDGLA